MKSGAWLPLTLCQTQTLPPARKRRFFEPAELDALECECLAGVTLKELGARSGVHEHTVYADLEASWGEGALMATNRRPPVADARRCQMHIHFEQEKGRSCDRQRLNTWP